MVFLALLRSSLFQYAVLAATSTVSPSPTNTHCPAYYITPVANSTGYTCGVRGSVAEPGFISRSCSQPDYGYFDGSQCDCYRNCIKDPRCVSFAWDPYNYICTNYGKSLKAKGFKSSEDYVYYYDLHGCYICDQPPTPIQSRCPTIPTALPSHLNYTCNVTGQVTAADDSVIQLYGQNSYTQCYRDCVRYSAVGLCKSFGYSHGGGLSGGTCNMYKNSLRQEGFNRNQTKIRAWNLRGCFDCHIPPTPTSTCIPTVAPVNPLFRNGNFSQTIFNPKHNLTQPLYWTSSNATRSMTAANGNVYVQVFH
jgi:hypothetical protein